MGQEVLSIRIFLHMLCEALGDEIPLSFRDGAATRFDPFEFPFSLSLLECFNIGSSLLKQQEMASGCENSK